MKSELAGSVDKKDCFCGLVIFSPRVAAYIRR
jgi:hypothetical protein